MSREQELEFWREKTEQLRARVMTQTKQSTDRNRAENLAALAGR